MLKTKRTFAAAFVVALGLGGTAVATAATKAPAPNAASSSAGQNNQGLGTTKPQVIVAKEVAKVAPLDTSAAFGTNTLLEGPAFDPNGKLDFVNLTAPPGQPKILQLDLKTKQTTSLYTDNTNSGFSSLQFSPADGKIYVTDFNTGNIDRLNVDGSGFTTVFSGPINGQTMVPDDIAFNPAGDMYITDYQGSPWNLIGRVIRLDAQGQNPIVVQGGLSAPNGISFTPDFSGLWVSELTLGREDHFTLSADGKSVAAGSVGMSANIGLTGFDSNSVDAAGNVYQCDVGGGKLLVWNTNGDLVATIVVPQTFPQPETLTTNLAIKPGTTDGYLTVGGANGGYIYKFRALAPGIPQSNGGGA